MGLLEALRSVLASNNSADQQKREAEAQEMEKERRKDEERAARKQALVMERFQQQQKEMQSRLGLWDGHRSPETVDKENLPGLFNIRSEESETSSPQKLSDERLAFRDSRNLSPLPRHEDQTLQHDDPRGVKPMPTEQDDCHSDISLPEDEAELGFDPKSALAFKAPQLTPEEIATLFGRSTASTETDSLGEIDLSDLEDDENTEHLKGTPALQGAATEPTSSAFSPIIAREQAETTTANALFKQMRQKILGNEPPEKTALEIKQDTINAAINSEVGKYMAWQQDYNKNTRNIQPGIFTWLRHGASGRGRAQKLLSLFAQENVTPALDYLKELFAKHPWNNHSLNSYLADGLSPALGLQAKSHYAKEDQGKLLAALEEFQTSLHRNSTSNVHPTH